MFGSLSVGVSALFTRAKRSFSSHLWSRSETVLISFLFPLILEQVGRAYWRLLTLSKQFILRSTMQYYVQNSVLYRLISDKEVEFWNPFLLKWEDALEVNDEVLSRAVNPVCGRVCYRQTNQAADRAVITSANKILRALKQLQLCRAIATAAHKGQKNKGDLKSIKVAGFCKNYASKCVAMLHDMIEDGGETVKSLIEKGVHPFIAERVQLVSKGNEQNDKDYLDTVATDPIACEVKLAELKHNMD